MNRQKLDQIVRQYVAEARKDLKNPPRRKFRHVIHRISPELLGLNNGRGRNLGLVNKLLEHNPAQVIQEARQQESSYESGLLMGYLFSDYEVSDREIQQRGSDDFSRGLTKGQVYKAKVLAAKQRRQVDRSIVTLVAGWSVYAYHGVYLLKPGVSELANKIREYSHYGVYAGLLYGIIPMILNGLYHNDLNPSKKLVTSGQFAMHRNPFYFGLLLTGASAATEVLGINLLSENPSWLAVGLTSVGLGWLYHSFYKYAVADEKILEKQFGQEYRDYKNKTPRFFPNPLNLFRRR
ncbi:MAG: isoprenylcysteine carboxylmethyltransferase family protein [Candidatus Nanoarchaeia archaeon]|nr:isoprenylcysteine carboxylmethyltransferase family protein [Candidatus Nanoarchaeia archaeon]